MKNIARIIYYDNTVEEYEYDSYTEALLAICNFKKAFGNQVSWAGVIQRRS